MQLNPSDVFGLGAMLVILVALPLWTVNRRCERLERMLNDVMTHLGMQGGTLREPSDAVKTLAQDPKQKIEAIRRYRQESGAGLREAKEAVERLAGQP